jgi:hypothetical protein
MDGFGLSNVTDPIGLERFARDAETQCEMHIDPDSVE